MPQVVELRTMLFWQESIPRDGALLALSQIVDHLIDSLLVAPQATQACFFAFEHALVSSAKSLLFEYQNPYFNA
jgi:hypothetical protein